MASRMIVDKVSLKVLQSYHHHVINSFGDQETLVEAISRRPGIFGPNPVAYISVLIRRPTLTRGDIDEALVNDRSLIRATGFRNSLFLLASADYSVYFSALHSQLKNSGMARLEREGVSASKLHSYGQVLLDEDFGVPQSHEQISELLFSKSKKISPSTEYLVVRKLCDAGLLVRVMAKGWKGNRFTFALMKKWLPELKLRPDNPESARTEVIRRYLRCYGPASYDDVAWWTGLTIKQVRRSVSHLRREAVRFRVDGFKDDLIGLRETVELFRKTRSDVEDIQFLPPWDPYTFGWYNRKRICDLEWAPWVMDQNANMTPVIISKGKVVGLWQFREGGKNIFEYHVFKNYSEIKKDIYRKAEEMSAILAGLSGSALGSIYEKELPAKLVDRGEGAFLWPLGKDLVGGMRGNEKLYRNPLERRSSNTFRNKYLGNPYVKGPGKKSTEDVAV